MVSLTSHHLFFVSVLIIKSACIVKKGLYRIGTPSCNTTEAMIIVLNGPLGIGKSTTAWALNERLDRSVMLDMDYIVAIHPFDYYHQPDLEYAYATAALLIRHHQAHGYRHFVVNWVFESAEQLQRFASHLEPTGLPLHSFYLTCDPDMLEQRIRRRNLSDVEWEVQRGRELVKILERAAEAGNIGVPIDTTSRSPDEVVSTIQATLHASLT
jgi:thymidylate kinase